MRIAYTLVLSIGFFAGMVIMELLLEYATSTLQPKLVSQSSIPAAITLSQFVWCFALPVLLKPKVIFSIKFNSRKTVYYIALALLIFGATGLATASLLYVSYPVKIVFKSTKLIPTMLTSYLFSGKMYSFLEYTLAALLCTGTIIFVYNPSGSSSGTSWVGIIFLLLSVFCDAFVPNIQRSIMDHVCAEELMANSNLFGLLGVLVYMAANGDLREIGFLLLSDEYWIRILCSLSGVGLSLAFSVLCYTNLIKEAGPVIAVAVATCRKVASIIFTYVVFPKPLTNMQILALAMIISGICFEALKNRPKDSSQNMTRLSTSTSVASADEKIAHNA